IVTRILALPNEAPAFERCPYVRIIMVGTAGLRPRSRRDRKYRGLGSTKPRTSGQESPNRGTQAGAEGGGAGGGTVWNSGAATGIARHVDGAAGSRGDLAHSGADGRRHCRPLRKGSAAHTHAHDVLLVPARG